MGQTSLDKSKIKFLLLEGVHHSAIDTLKASGYSNIVSHPKALPEDQLCAEIADAHFIGSSLDATTQSRAQLRTISLVVSRC